MTDEIDLLPLECTHMTDDTSKKVQNFIKLIPNIYLTLSGHFKVHTKPFESKIENLGS